MFDNDYKNDGDWGTALTSADDDARRGFVRKVYGILAMQLLVTFGFVAFVKSDQELNDSMIDWWFLYIPAVIVQLTIWCVLLCCKNVARSVPTNYVLLGVFTLCWTYLLGFICSLYPAGIVLLAAGFTAIITVTLSIYACVTSTDFTQMCGPFFCIGLLIIITVSMLCSILSSIFITMTGEFYPFYTGFCIILYGIYLLIDTQLIVGGGRYELSIDDYIIGAMIIYMDIVILFIKLLELFGRR